MAEENPFPGEPDEKGNQGRRSASDAAPNTGEASPRPEGQADPLARLFAASQEPVQLESLPGTAPRTVPDAPEAESPIEEDDLRAEPTPAPILPERLSHTTEMAALSAQPPVLPPTVPDNAMPSTAANAAIPDLPEEQPAPVHVAPPVAVNPTQIARTASVGAPPPVAAPAPDIAPPSPSRQVISLATISAAQSPMQIPSATQTPSTGEISSTIRCRQCGKRASSELALCPHCGRELKPAPSRWLTVGLPTAVGVLLLALLALQGGNGPLGIVGAPVRALNDWVSELSASLDPQVTVIPSANNPGAVALSEDIAVNLPPAEGAAEASDSSFADVSDASLIGGEENAAPELEAASPSLPEQTTTDAITTTVEPTDTVPTDAVPVADTPLTEEVAQAAAPVEPPTEAPANTPEPTPTPSPTDTPAPTDTPVPTDTPAPTNTPLPATYTVASGDTALGIAARLGIDLQALIAHNNMSAAQASMLQPGQVLQIPGGVVTPNTEAGETAYTVRDGDTLVVIAQRNGISVAQLMAANGLSQSDAFTLRPGQTLIIPGPTPAPSPTSTDTPAPTPVPVVAATATTAPTMAATSVAPTATSAANAATLRVTAPRLRAPISGVSLSCSVEGRLQWNASADIEPADNYRVHLGFVSGRDDAGNLKITWLVEQSVPSTQTSLPLDSSLCGTAPDDFGGQWRWYVDVVTDINGTKAPVSTPSEIWGFAWQ